MPISCTAQVAAGGCHGSRSPGAAALRYGSGTARPSRRPRLPRTHRLPTLPERAVEAPHHATEAAFPANNAVARTASSPPGGGSASGAAKRRPQQQQPLPPLVEKLLSSPSLERPQGTGECPPPVAADGQCVCCLRSAEFTTVSLPTTPSAAPTAFLPSPPPCSPTCPPMLQTPSSCCA